MAPNDNNEFERKSSFLNKRPSPIDAHPEIKKKTKQKQMPRAFKRENTVIEVAFRGVL